MDARFRMGSMGSVVGEKFVESLIIVLNIIYLSFYSQLVVARMQEGIISLMQMGKTSVSLKPC